MHTEQRRQRLIEVARRRQQGAVLLEDIHDPHNAEAVFRSCDALGFQRVGLIFHKSPPFDPLGIGKSSSASANKWLTFEAYRSPAECVDALHAEGFEVVATVLDTGAESIYQAQLLQPQTAILLGSEQLGLSAEAIALADRRLTIPMPGMVKSLNLSVTAALCLYELTRQRLARGMGDYLYPAADQEALATEFLKRGS